MADTNVHICLACGAPLDVPVQGGRVKCSFCGAVNVVHPQAKNMGDEIICPACGAAIPKDAQHCGRCGIKLEFNCPKCGASNSYGTVFCVQCGVDIQTEIKRQQEETRRQQEEARHQQEEERRLQEEMQQRMEEERRKLTLRKRITSLVVTTVVLAGVVCAAGVLGIRAYNASYSPSARSTKTAYAAGQTATADYVNLFKDDFSDMASGWTTFSTASSSVGYENDGYRFHVIKANWTAFSTLDNSFPSDVRIEAQATKIGGPDNNNFGILCRLQDTKNYYYFAISSDGFGSISKIADGKFVIISSADQKWHQVSGIREGDATNTIQADCIGDTLTLFVNGNMVATATDSSFGNGRIGLEAGTGDTGGADILFDNFKVTRP